MSKITMPPPIQLIHMAVIEDGELRMMSGRKPIDCELYAMPDLGSAPTLIPAEQAEAHAAARVQEVLEEAAQACEARIGQYSPGLTPEDVEDCDEEARLCAGAIRALAHQLLRPGQP